MFRFSDHDLLELENTHDRMRFDDRTITTISFALVALGLVVLAIGIARAPVLTHAQVEEADDGVRVSLSGTVKGVRAYGNVTVVTLRTTCDVSAVIIKDNAPVPQVNASVVVKGTKQVREGRMEILVDNIR